MTRYFGLPDKGPVHEEEASPGIPARALCRARRQYRHFDQKGPSTCKECLRRKARQMKGQRPTHLILDETS